jgi:hypothetical protein
LIANRKLIVHGVTGEAWAKRYGIVPFTRPCIGCGQPMTTSVPFAQGQLRGLVAPRCSCGNPNQPYCVVRDPKHGDLFSGGAL